MPDLRKNGATSNRVRFKLTKSADGTAYTGLTSSSTGLIISTICDNEATATQYTVASSNVETITTLGTFSTPTSGKCRFKEVDATNHPGLYEFQFADARFAVSGARRLIVSVSGVSGLFSSDYEIELISADLFDSVRLGLTALPNAAADAAGGLPISDAGGLDLDTLNSNVSAVLADTGTDGVVVAAGSKTGYSLTATTGLGNQTADITGSLSGSVGSVTGAVGSVTGNVGGNVAGSVGSVTGGINTGAGVITTLDGLDTAQDTQHSTTQGKVDTAQADLDLLTGTDGATLATSQPNYAPATAAAATAIEADTQDIQSRLPAALVNSRMDSTIDGTGMESGAITAIWTTALTEAYRSTGAAGTASQLLHEILQNLTEFAITSTTKTVKKFDGSTTAKTYTLDDATTPTSITETT